MRSLVMILLTACATVSSAPKGGPRGLRTSEHLAAARQHEELATLVDELHRRTGQELETAMQREVAR